MRLIAAIFVLLLTGCGYDRFDTISRDDIDGTDMLRNCDIALLRENYFGNRIVIQEDIVITGWVTANDLSGNWYRSFMIDDGTGAVEIRAGLYGTHLLYGEGRRIVVSLKGLAVGSYDGVLQLGRKINHYSDWQVEEFGARAIIDEYVIRDSSVGNVSPLDMGIPELNTGYAGRLVRIGPVTVDTAGLNGITWADAGGADTGPSTGTVRFYDTDGGRIDVVTSGYADFARAPVPTGKVWLTGILLYGKFDGGSERFGLRLRGLNDVQTK